MTSQITFQNRLKFYLLNFSRPLIEKMSRKKIQSCCGLWEELSKYLHQSETTGCGYSDYWALYSYVRKQKPLGILECGTGVSTIVMAYALIENRQEGFTGQITSMESEPKYFEMAKSLMPEHMKPYVDLVLSPVVEDQFALFRGVRYKNVPTDRTYDFVYVDGPSYVAPSDKTLTFDFDLLKVILGSEKPVGAIIDKRVSTCYVMQKLLGTKRVTYNAYRHLGFVRPSSRKDVRHFDQVTPSSAFDGSLSVFGSSELRLDLNSFYDIT